jgi:hypothetical protein
MLREAISGGPMVLPSLLVTAVVAACDRTLSRLAQAHDGPLGGGADDVPGGPAALVQRVGADDWDELRERYDTNGASS